MTAPAVTPGVTPPIAWTLFAMEGLHALLRSGLVRVYDKPDPAQLRQIAAWTAAYADALMTEWSARYGS